MSQNNKKVMQTSLKTAEMSDYSRISEFLRQEFYPDEHITSAHPLPGQLVENEGFFMAHLKSETVFIAIEKNTEKLAGVLIAGPINCMDSNNLLSMARMTSSSKWADILRLLAYVESKADVCRRFQVPKSLQIHVVAVHKQFRGNQIGQKLFQRCFEVAEEKLYRLISVDCTSLYSIKIAEQLGMEFVSEVTYKEYHKFMGEKIFKPKEPHTVIKTFVMKIIQPQPQIHE